MLTCMSLLPRYNNYFNLILELFHMESCHQMALFAHESDLLAKAAAPFILIR